MTPDGRCEGSHFEVLILQFEKRLHTMIPLFDVKASLTTHQRRVLETVTIGGYDGVPLQALAHVIHG